MSIRPLLILSALTLLLLAAGCQTDPGPQLQLDYASGNYAAARQVLQPLAAKTDENYVLNNVRLGSVTLPTYDLRAAESAFLNAYDVLNSTGTNDTARAMSAAILSESTKIWKGEPFERAMCNYYLGLIYYIEHDYNNSRAAFENALFKLRDYGDANDPQQYSQFESDFVLAYMMLGKCYQHLDRPDQARAMFDQAARIRPDLSDVARGLRQPDNVLIVADYNWGPRKITTVDHAFAGWGPRPEEVGPVPLPQVLVDGWPATLVNLSQESTTLSLPQVPVDGQSATLTAPPLPLVDLLALAQDHKWQDIDTIRAVKSVAGKALMGVGAYEATRSNNSGNIDAGLGMIAAGALIDASSQADLRQWEELPRSVFLIPMQLSPGPHDVTLTFPTGDQQTWHGLIAPPAGQENAYYYRMLNSLPPDHYWPPPGAAPADAAN
jgi:tetratricopeptide (TPR) repeat protein